MSGEEKGLTIFGVALLVCVAFGFMQAKACYVAQATTDQKCIDTGGQVEGNNCRHYAAGKSQ